MRKLLALLLLLPALAFGQKISTLPSATTPLAGTEIMPLVQGGTTKQASITSINGVFLITAQETAASVTPTNLAYPFLDARRYGVVCDGTTDNTAAMQTAHSMALPIYYPVGTCKFTHITMGGGGIVGSGYYDTNFVVTDLTSSNSITVNTSAYGPLFANFSITPSATKSGGYAIVFAPATSYINSPKMENIFINNFPNGIDSVSTSGFILFGSTIYGTPAGGNAFLVQNQNNADAGDSTIEACLIGGGATTAIGINFQSSGGLRIINNKFLQFGTQILLNQASGTNTSDLLITGNSMENAYTSAITLQSQGGGAAFANVLVTGNQFELTSASNTSNALYTTNGSIFLTGLTFNDNVVHGYNTAGYGVYIDWVTDAMVANNILIGNAGTSVGVYLGTNNTAGSVMYGINKNTGFGTSLAPSNSNAQITFGDVQTGTANITTSNAIGNVFSNSSTVTFPTACQFVDLGHAGVTITSASGGIAVYPYSISLTQLAITAVGQAAATVVPVRWTISCVE